MIESAGTVDNRGPAVLAVTTGLLVVSTIFVILRLISRIGVVKKISKDDYFIMLAWVIAFGMSFSICYGTYVGLGKHEADVKSQHQNALKKCQFTFSVLYNPALMATKSSIGFFYLTLAKNQQIFKWSTICTLIVVNVAGTALTFLNIFQCRPVNAGFEDNNQSVAHCTDIVTLYLSSAPVNIITDLALLFLPMPILTAIRLPRNEKIILVITFSFGAFVAVVDVIRIAYLQSASLARLQDTTGSVMQRQGDFSWNASLSFMWSAIEVHVGIICACVPGIKPLVARLFPNLLGRITHAVHGKSRSSASEHQWANAMAPTQSKPPPGSPGHARNTNIAYKDREMGLAEFLKTSDMPEEIGTLEFVTMPDTQKSLSEARTNLTANSKKSRSASLTVFDFVNVKNTKSMVEMSNREALGPLAFVTILFFLWGFAYGLLDILNSQFQQINKTSPGQVVGLHSAYFGAYFVAPLTFGRIVFRKWGFKATFITGLCIYACGTLVFWPSAVLASFPAFLISNFIVGLGVATLETAGNPFIALCGPPQYAEVRLNISQAIQAIGTVASPLLAKKVLFKNTVDAASLIDVQWTYLGIALFDVVLAVVFFYVPLPEASDDELENVAQKRSINETKVGGISIVHITLGLGMFSQFCYVGGQEAVSGVFQRYVEFVKPHAVISWFDYQSVGHSVFAVGRLFSAIGGLFIKPRRVLLFLYVGVIITAVLAMNLSGYSGIAMIILTTLFESGIFSIIFAMCIRGLGAHTKDGAVLLTASVSGGAVVPAIMKGVTDRRGPQSVQYGFCVIVAFFVFGSVLPFYTAFVPWAKKQVDPIRDDLKASDDPELPIASSRVNRAFSVMRRKRISSELPMSVHIEG